MRARATNKEETLQELQVEEACSSRGESESDGQEGDNHTAALVWRGLGGEPAESYEGVDDGP